MLISRRRRAGTNPPPTGRVSATPSLGGSGLDQFGESAEALVDVVTVVFGAVAEHFPLGPGACPAQRGNTEEALCDSRSLRGGLHPIPPAGPGVPSLILGVELERLFGDVAVDDAHH